MRRHVCGIGCGSLRSGLVTPIPGGSGHRVGRHYDRSARCLLDWDRVTEPASQETRPGAEWRSSDRHERRDGALVGERIFEAERHDTPLRRERMVALLSAPSPRALPEGKKDDGGRAPDEVPER